MLFKFKDETYSATAGCSLLSGYAQANQHFGSRLPHPGAWMEGKRQPIGDPARGMSLATYYWAEGNFFD